ncbi:MAG: DUF3885 domain-containing protein [Bacteroidia bacterium]|nr:DUF3885 domain-containing protein [Bacteroidia bacterium]
MRTLKQEFRQFLKDNFKGLRPRKPLFYSWEFGLRFDLQVGNISNSTRLVVDADGNSITKNVDVDTDEYFIQVVHRATNIFQSACDSSDRMFLVLMDYKHRRRKIRQSNFVFRQIAELKQDEIAYTKEYRLYEPSDRLDIRNIALVKLNAGRINHKNILTAVSHTDFPPRQPRLDSKGFFSSKEIYFINIDKKLILHMYDDRGFDIIATDKETLRPIYQKHNDWILDYDRKEIDKQFK